MFGISNITVSFDGVDLFSGISFIINQKDRIGLVGKNGAGKSSLLKVILGRIQPTHGSIDIPNEKTIGYLAQEVDLNTTKTVLEETLKAFEEINAIETEIDELTKELGIREDYESDSYAEVIERLNVLHEKMNLHDSSKRESEVEKVLKGLGFKRNEFDRPLDTFSGGWQMRVELAKLLLRTPDLLLMDEPTNHLDIESILWLEEYLKSYPGAVMMVSHDRMFLDNVTNRTIEIVAGKTYDYKAAYSKFMELRKERIEHQQNAYENQQKFIEQQERFINRFRAKASKAKSVQSKVKQLEKLDRIEIDDKETAEMRFRFPPAPRSGQVVVKADSLYKSYGEKQVLKDLNFNVIRGEKVAFVGKNGMGKTTLVNLINGMEATKGSIELGHNVSLNYYAQIQEKSLDIDKTVLQTIEDAATDEMAKPHKIRALLGAFLFGEEDVEKKVKVLSGGEKSRLALAKMLLSEANLLILDEPTNHLDMTSKEVLKKALKDFDGTLIVVSHDREFLSNLTDKTFEFIDGGIKEHFGTIEDFLEAKRLQNFREFETELKKKKASSPAPKKETKTEAAPKKNNYADQKQRQKEERQIRKSIARTESKIEKLENELEEVEQLMQEDATNKEHFFKHSEIQKQLDQQMEMWESLENQLKEFNES